MLNKLLVAAGLALGVVACASNPSTPAPATPKVAAAPGQPAAGCVDTGSRIPVSPGECSTFGHAWTQSDVKSSGATDAGQALRLLDPTMTIRGQ